MKIDFFLAIFSFTVLTSTALVPDATHTPFCEFDSFTRSLDCANVGLESFLKVDTRTGRLDLSDNKLEFLEESAMESLTSLLYLKISGNPFKCDCHLEWLRQELSGNFRKHRFTVLDGRDISCFSPENVAGKFLNLINDTFYCDNRYCKNLASESVSEDVMCDENALCTRLDQRYKCQCKTGYRGDGLSCLDINECSNTKHHGCHSNATCINTAGSYLCQCMLGYHGDGRLSCQAFKNVTAHIQKQAQTDSRDGNPKDRRAERVVEITVIAVSFALIIVLVVLVFVCL